MLTHYAGLGDTRSTRGLPLPRAPEEDRRSISISIETLVEYLWRFDTWARCSGRDEATSIDPRRVDCPDCLRDLPEVRLCACGAPALYGADAEHDARYCAEHTPDWSMCVSCLRPMFDAREPYCDACLDPNEPHGTLPPPSYGDPAGSGCAVGL